MKFPKYRSVNIELMTELLYWDYKSRFSLYNKLNNELKEKWIKLYPEHSIISEAGIKSLDENLRKKIRMNAKDKFNIKGKFDHRIEVDFFSEQAWKLIQEKGLNGIGKKFRYEHIVPKKKFIQSKIEKKAREGILGKKLKEEIKRLLEKFYYVALITIEEDKKLLSLKLGNDMPNKWNDSTGDIFARYKLADINLIPNPFIESE